MSNHKVTTNINTGEATYRGVQLKRLYNWRGKPNGWTALVGKPEGRIFNTTSRAALLALLDTCLDTESTTMTTYNLTPEQVQAAIAGHDLHTYKGWCAAAAALLAGAPDWTGIKEYGGFIVKVNGHICGCAENNRADAIYTEDDLFDFDDSAWVDDAWDGVDAKSNSAELENPVFVNLKHD